MEYSKSGGGGPPDPIDQPFIRIVIERMGSMRTMKRSFSCTVISDLLSMAFYPLDGPNGEKVQGFSAETGARP